MISRKIALVFSPLLLVCATSARAENGIADDVGPAFEVAAPPAGVTDAATSEAVEPAETAPLSNGSDVQVPAKKKWEFATIGYIFFAGAHGKTTPRDPLPPVDLDLKFGDILKAFKFAFMGAAEARNDRLVFLGDLMWVHLGEGKGLKVRDVNFADVKIDSKTWEVTALGGYRVVNNGPVFVDLMAGGRLNGNKQGFSYRGQLLDLSASVSKTWFDPIVATRVSAPLGGKFGMSLYGDIGGFGVGSDLTWQGIATVNYQVSRKMTVGLGWRYFKINFDDNDGFLYNVAQSGPILSLRTVF
jgi:opacity protein-like surface antigen